MRINSNSWHARVFFFADEIWKRFKSQEFSSLRPYYQPLRTNLCYYVRVIILYAPIVIISHLMLVPLGTITFLWPGFIVDSDKVREFGWDVVIRASKFWVMILLLALALVLLVFIIKCLVKFFEKKANSKKTKAKKVTSNKTPSFLKVLAEWFRAQKQKVCPIIEFTENQRGGE